MNAEVEKRFGFLREPIAGDFSGIRIAPLSDHAERLSAFELVSNRDGFFYPPTIATYHTDLATGELKDKVARSERPASVYPLPASHTLTINSPIHSGDPAYSDAALIVHLLAFLYGTRLQLSDWRFEGRVPVKGVHDLSPRKQDSIHFLDHAYQWWRRLSEELRTRVVNFLYVYTRARSLEWEWDAFLYQYMVFDALYKLHIQLNGSRGRNITHRQRFDLLLNDFGIPANVDLVDQIYKARNELFHEAMWTGSTIGFATSGNVGSYYLPSHLSRLNSRIFCNLIGYKNEYASSVWWAMGRFLFDRLR